MIYLAVFLSLTSILFLGRDNVTAKVKAIYINKSFVKQTEESSEEVYGILLDRTSFYAESGGQEYDTGSIVIDGVADFKVSNTQVDGGYVLHIGSFKYGRFSVGDEVVATYDEVSPADWFQIL